MNEKLRAALGTVSAALAKMRKIAVAVTRARGEAEASAARIASARRALVAASADAAVGAPVPGETLVRLHSDLEAAERDAEVRAEVSAELALRLEGFEEQLTDGQSALVRARDEAAAEASAAFLADARRALTPGIARLAALSQAGASGTGIGTAATLASLLGVRFEADPRAAEAELAAEIQSAASALGTALDEIRESRRERYNRAQLAKREGPRAA